MSRSARDAAAGCPLTQMGCLVMVLSRLRSDLPLRRAMTLDHHNTAPYCYLGRSRSRLVRRPKVEPRLSGCMVDPYNHTTDSCKPWKHQNSPRVTVHYKSEGLHAR